MATAPTIEPQNYGEAFTRRWVVETVLDLVGYTPDQDLVALHLVEPSCGTGAFLGPAIERLIQSASRYGQPLESLAGSITALDLQAELAETSKNLCEEILLKAGLDVGEASTLAES
jgi:adenine-specific DNA-methyltransferase